ncbi:MAG: hypothetical protein R3326_06415 [Gemmatimonadota bacterium]|nr:hypothetical protein [Gemmatimonadota bacterium]
MIAVLLAGVGPAAAQTGEQSGPSIPELRRLADEREARLLQIESRLARIEAQQDSLVGVKRRAQPGSARFEEVSNRIRELSRQIQPLQRDLTTFREQLRNLRQRLFLRYVSELAEMSTRFEALKRQGLTPQTSAEMRRIIERYTEYSRAREEIQRQLEEVQAALALPELAYDPTDGPRELRIKLATARDAVAVIDSLVDLIDDQIDEIRADQRMRREARQLRDDLEFWGDDRSNQSADELSRILEERGALDPFRDPERRIERLRERREDLVERRREYLRKAELFDQQLQEFYR